MNIGQAAHAAGVSAKMIRHYESFGLIQTSQRTATGYRVYHETDVHTLRFIKHGRQLGFSLKRIKELLSLWQDCGRSSADVKAIALEHIREVQNRIDELMKMRDALQQLAQACVGNERPECPIIHELAGASCPV